MNQTALLTHNALSTAVTASTAHIQELVNELEEKDRTIAKLEEMVRERDAKIEQLEPKVVGQ